MIRIKKEIVILIGIPGAGKSTFYKKYFSDYGYVNLDTIKDRAIEEKMVKKFFKEGKNFVVDNTNIYKADRQRYIPFAIYHGYKIVGYYFKQNLKASIKRNSQRERRVPEETIRKYNNILLKNKPSYNEGFDELYVIINNNKDMIVKEYKN